MLRLTNAMKNLAPNIFNFVLQGIIRAIKGIDFSQLVTQNELGSFITRLGKRYVCRTMTTTHLVEAECKMEDLHKFDLRL